MTQGEDDIIEQALLILELRLKSRAVFWGIREVIGFLRLQSRGIPEEITAVMYLDANCRLIEYERQETVEPLKIARKARANEAAAVIVHHNYADGCCWPKLSDLNDANKIATALHAIGVPLLDHLITCDEGAYSMEKRRFA